MAAYFVIQFARWVLFLGFFRSFPFSVSGLIKALVLIVVYVVQPVKLPAWILKSRLLMLQGVFPVLTVYMFVLQTQ
jgi:hypothetical protein